MKDIVNNSLNRVQTQPLPNPHVHVGSHASTLRHESKSYFNSEKEMSRFTKAGLETLIRKVHFPKSIKKILTFL